MGNPNLYDGDLALVFWTPSSVNQTTIAQLADTIKGGAPNVNALLVKTNNGTQWQGALDSSKPNLAINSIADVQRWSTTLAARNMKLHAWCVVRGINPTAEADFIANICLNGGVRSMMLDLEQGPFYFVGDQNAARALATSLRQRVGPDFHIGLIFDYRGTRPEQLWVQSVWFPEIDSLIPMVYHFHFGQTAQQALQTCYNKIGSWGKPIYPMLQGYSPGGSIGLYPASDIPVTANLAINQFKARGLSWYRFGKGLSISDEGLGPADLPELAKVSLPVPPPVVVPPPPPPPPPVVVGPPPAPPDATPTLIVVDPDNERTGEFAINYYDDPNVLNKTWAVALDNQGRPYAYRPASFNVQTLYVSYLPRLIGRGRYFIEAYIPGNNASIPDAHYVIVDYPNGVRRETTCRVNQGSFFDAWVTLQGDIINGVPGGPVVNQFDLDPIIPDSGRVNVADITFVDPSGQPGGKFDIAFGAIRWRPINIASLSEVNGLDPPVGTEAERRGPLAAGGRTVGGFTYWAGQWFDANPIGTRYLLTNGWAVHTGADLNLDGNSVIADKDAPVHAMGDGLVLWARRGGGSWGNYIIIEHSVPSEDRLVWARYAHVNNQQVQEGQMVRRGQQICTIGEYAPNNYHLHFDIALEPVLRSVPGHWPGDNPAEVQRVYTDPLAFLQRYHRVR